MCALQEARAAVVARKVKERTRNEDVKAVNERKLGVSEQRS